MRNDLSWCVCICKYSANQVQCVFKEPKGNRILQLTRSESVQENQGNVAIIKSLVPQVKAQSVTVCWPCAPSVLGQSLNSTTTWVTVGLWSPGIDIGRFSLQVCKTVVRPCCLQGTVWYPTSRSWRRSFIFHNQCVSTFYFFILESLPQLLIHPDNPWTAQAASSL